MHGGAGDCLNPDCAARLAVAGSAAAAVATLVETAQEAAIQEQREGALVRRLNDGLGLLEPGCMVNRTTPKDGHSLFHAFRRGGVANLQTCPCALTIVELRGMALSMASKEQLEVAAASTGIGIAVKEYLKRMCSNDFADNLIVALMAQIFETPITVVSMNGVRTWWPDGREAEGATPESV